MGTFTIASGFGLLAFGLIVMFIGLVIGVFIINKIRDED